MDKSPDAFRTISEAADELDLPQHVLRFWETRFSTIRPLKRGGGRRYYRPEDVTLLKGIRRLLYDQGFTIKGVQRILKEQGVRYVIGIGEGRPLGELPPPSADIDDDDEAAAPQVAMADGADSEATLSPQRRPLGSARRDKLNAVLGELWELKKLLERAREG